jgi:alkylation response protein AidB-like acyl-CoA dehydrogenase
MRFRAFESEAAFLCEIESFAQSYVREHAAKIDANDVLPDDFVAEFAVRRLFALEKLDETHTSLGLPERCDLVLKAIGLISFVSASAAKIVLDQNFGQVQMFRQYATQELRSTFIPKIQSGETQMALLMTEPHTGSNLSKLKCTAKRTNGGFSIHGGKDWITGAETRTLYLVVAKSHVNPNHFGLFFVDSSNYDTKRSIRISPRKRLLGLRGPGEYSIEFDNTFVPQTGALIPFGESTITKIMEHYNLKRCGAAAIAIGLSKAALHCAYHYASQRYPSRDGRLAFQDAEFNCAKMYCLIQASEQLNNWAVAQVLAGDNTGVPSSAAKLFATESAVKITNAAIQLCGANATSQEMPLERFMRDARMLTIAGGTSEILKRTIARNLPLRLGGDKFV